MDEDLVESPCDLVFTRPELERTGVQKAHDSESSILTDCQRARTRGVFAVSSPANMSSKRVHHITLI